MEFPEPTGYTVPLLGNLAKDINILEQKRVIEGAVKVLSPLALLSDTLYRCTYP